MVIDQNNYRRMLKAFKDADPSLTYCVGKGGKNGYTHVHLRNRPRAPGSTKCTTHSFVIEQRNGALRIHKQLHKHLPPEIKAKFIDSKAPGSAPDGKECAHSAGPKFGRFKWCLPFGRIEQLSSGKLTEFARDLVGLAQPPSVPQSKAASS